MGSVREEKDRLRRVLLQRRRELGDRAEKDRLIARAVSDLPLYRQAEQVLFYVNLKTELSTELLLEEAWRLGKEVYAPRCRPDGSLQFYRVLCREELVPGSFGIFEPDEGRCPPLRDLRTDCLCLVPGVAFDREGNRLGYGKGYYDRFLAGKGLFCLGLCYEELLLLRLPREEHDRRVDLIVTEAGAVPIRKEGNPHERKSS